MIPIPKQCPECGSDVEFVGPKMFCRNRECPAQSFGKIKKSLKIMGVLGIGDGILSSLINTYEIESFIDLVKVMMKDNLWSTEDMAKIKIGAASLGMSRASNIRNEVQALSKGVSLAVFIDALQIQFLGTSNSERVAEFCKNSLENFLGLNISRLLSIDKVGHEMSDIIMIGINRNRDTALQLLQYIPILKPEPEPEPEKEPSVPIEKQLLGGASFCISGKLSHSKNHYYDMIEKLGGEAHKNIKSDTTYLVVESIDKETNKIKKARKAGITIIDEEELNRILGTV